MAHVRKLESGRWQARYRGPDGREHASNFTRKVDAERWLTAAEGSKLKGDWIDPKAGRASLSELYESWCTTRSLAPSTAEKWDGVWRVHVEPRLGSRPIDSLRRDDVTALLAAISSPWQGAEALKLLRVLLNRAVDRDLLTRNVAARVAAPRTNSEPINVLTPAELTAAVEELPHRWRALVLLGAYSSLRWSELVALKRHDLDLEKRTVRVDEAMVEVRGRFEWGPPKTEGSARVVDLPMVAVRPLAEHLLRYPPLLGSDLEGLVFYTEGGFPVRRRGFRPIWQRACTAARIDGPVRLEWLRHTGASIAYAATGDLKATAARLGHKNTRMVDNVYVELYEETSKAVADAIDELVARTSRGLSADS